MTIKTQHPDQRVCNSHDLRILAERAQQFRFNRVPVLPDNLDEKGTHLIIRDLFGHNMEQAKNVLHHRCRVLIKVADDTEPVIVSLDVRDEDFENLHVVEAAIVGAA
jgi:hypothetical protein